MYFNNIGFSGKEVKKILYKSSFVELTMDNSDEVFGRFIFEEGQFTISQANATLENLSIPKTIFGRFLAVEGELIASLAEMLEKPVNFIDFWKFPLCNLSSNPQKAIVLKERWSEAFMLYQVDIFQIERYLSLKGIPEAFTRMMGLISPPSPLRGSVLFEAVASVLQREVDSEPLHRYIQIRQGIEPYRRRLSRWSVLRQKPVKEKKIEGLLNWELVDVARRFFEEYDLSFDRLVDYLRNGQLEWGQRVEEQKEGLVFYGDFSPFNSLMDAVEGVLLLEAEQSERVLSQQKLTRAA
jgi:hypothetical protein